jgi:hypothetical protein
MSRREQRTPPVPVQAIYEFYCIAGVFLDAAPAIRWTEDRIAKAKALDAWLKAVAQGGDE